MREFVRCKEHLRDGLPPNPNCPNCKVTNTDKYDAICRNRVYECLGCNFVGLEEEALEHQSRCDHPMRDITKKESCKLVDDI